MLRFKALDFNWFILKKVQDMVNKIDDGSGVLDFEDFVTVILQISAFYFPTFEKADCTIFALSVGRSVSPLIFLLLFYN